MLTQLIPIAIAITIAIIWWGNTATKEKAVMAAKRACQQSNVQLLDDTVALKRYRLVRDHNGNMRIARLYIFEFSTMGDERKQGFVTFVGYRIKELNLRLSV